MVHTNQSWANTQTCKVKSILQQWMKHTEKKPISFSDI